MKKPLAALFFLSAWAGLLIAPATLEGDDGRAPFAVKAGEANSQVGEDENAQEEDAALEERIYRQGGLIITIRMMADDRDVVDFEVITENLTGLRKSLSGRICLFDLRVRDRDCGSGEEPVFMDLAPGSKEKKKYRVHKKSFYGAWTFIIKRIHDF